MKGPRVFQITALLLVLVAVVQVGWWLFDQHAYTSERTAQMQALYAQHAEAARALLERGVPEDRVRAMLPGVSVGEGHAASAESVSAALKWERRRRMNQYVWEGAFFLLALGACIGVIWRALRAEAKVRQEQDSFLALVSHQFKTPLASLQLSLETMALRPVSPEQSRVLIDRMLSDLARMEAMVSQILDSVRLERGRVELRREPLSLASAVGRVVSHFEERARNDNIELVADVPRDLYVLGDPLAVDVVVRNLIENALAAVGPAGGGRITLEARRMNGEVELSVRDTGVGFDPVDRSRLFQKFSRLHTEGTGSSHYGTGLGLYIVKRLMHMAGGRVSAHSEGVGRGAQFVLVWPVASAESP